MKHNFHHKNLIGVALAPQSVANTSVNGPDIVEPWRKARQLSLIAMGGAWASGATGALVIQGKKRSDGTYENLKEHDGTTDLAFTPAPLADGQAIENGAILGTLLLSRVSADTYSALRLRFTESGNAAALVAVAYVLSDVERAPTGQVDDLFAKQRPSN